MKIRFLSSAKRWAFGILSATYLAVPAAALDITERASGFVVYETTEGFCDIHYRVNGGVQLNYAMNRLDDGRCSWPIAPLVPGDRLEVFTTFQQGGLAYDSPVEFAVFQDSPTAEPGQVQVETISADAIAFGVLSEGFCDIHYRVNRGVQLNYPMQRSPSGECRFVVDGLNNGDRLDYFATYQVGGLAYDSPWTSLTFGNGSVPTPQPTPTVTPSVTPSPSPTPMMTPVFTPIPTPSPDLPDAYPGYSGQYPGFSLEIDDRFDTFDDRSWTKGDAGFTENDCRFQDQGVGFEDGVMKLIVREEFAPASWSLDQNRWIEEKNFTCGELRSRDRMLYGRFEARVRNPRSAVASGYISSLFTYVNDVQGDFMWREIDVEMEGSRPDKFQANLIFGNNTWMWSETRQWGAYEDKITIGPTDQWRVYAIEWVPGAIRWYVDGVLQKTLSEADVDGDPLVPPQIFPANIPRIPQQVMMNFWIPNDLIQDAFGGNKRDNVYPMTAEYDWFRYYRYTP